MTRCRHFTATIAALGLLLAVLPASGQQQPLATTGAAVRNFPANALRGSVTFVSGNKLLLNGNAGHADFPLASPGSGVFGVLMTMLNNWDIEGPRNNKVLRARGPRGLERRFLELTRGGPA